MNKIIIGLAVLAVITIGWFLLGNNTIEYVATVDDEVAQLEDELATLEAQVSVGTLSPEDAALAQAKIVARIDAINNTVSEGQKSKLTDAQRVQLIDGLERLKQALIKYRDTLEAVDEAVLKLPEEERPKLKRGGGKKNSIAIIAKETIETVDEQVEEIIEEIIDEEIVEEVENSIASSTDEVSGDSDISTNETDMETGTSAEEGSAEPVQEAEEDQSREEPSAESSDDSTDVDPAPEEESDTAQNFIFSDTEAELQSEAGSETSTN